MFLPVVLLGHQWQTVLFFSSGSWGERHIFVIGNALPGGCSQLGLGSPPSGVCKAGSAQSVVTQAKENKGTLMGMGGCSHSVEGLGLASDISPANVRLRWMHKQRMPQVWEEPLVEVCGPHPCLVYCTEALPLESKTRLAVKCSEKDSRTST